MMNFSQETCLSVEKTSAGFGCAYFCAKNPSVTQEEKKLKKEFRRILSLLLAFVLIFAFAGCGKKVENVDEKQKESTTGEVYEKSGEEKSSHYPVTIKNYNYAGDIVEETYNEAPKKVVAVYQNSIETLLALGLEDHIVLAAGLDHKVKPEFEDAFSKVNYFENGFAPDKETVLMSEPDMILSWYSYFGEKNLGDVDYWNENGVHTYMSSNSGVIKEKNLQNEYDDILNLGKIFDVEDKAEKIVDEMKAEIEKVSEHTKNTNEKVSVMVLEKLGDEIRVYGKNTIAGDMVSTLGGELIDVDGGKLGEEDLVNLNPDIIFTVYMDRDDKDAPGDAVKVFTEAESLQNLNAIKNEKVYPIALGEMYCSGVRTLDGIKTFAKGMYPEIYE